MKRQTLIVKSVPRQSHQNRNTHSLTYGGTRTVPLNKTKANDVTEQFYFSPNASLTKYVTGGEELVNNEFVRFNNVDELREAYALDSTWTDAELEKIRLSERINLQTYYEILDGVTKDFYNNRVVNSIFTARAKDLRDRETKTTFIQKFYVVLYDGENYFHSDTARGRWAIQLLKNHPLVAKDKEKINTSIHHFYIASENEELLETDERLRLKEDSIFAWKTFQKEATEFQIHQLGSLLKDSAGYVIRGNVSAEDVKRKISVFLDKDATNMKTFLNVIKLTNDAPGMKIFDIKYLVRQALNTELVQVRTGQIVWVTREEETFRSFKTIDEFEKAIMKEKEAFSPKDKSLNFYQILVDELKDRNVRLK